MRKCQIAIICEDNTIKATDWILNTDIETHLEFLQRNVPTTRLADKLIGKDVIRYDSIQDLVLNKGDFPVFIFSPRDKDWLVIE